jgi:hypothetical protein
MLLMHYLNFYLHWIPSPLTDCSNWNPGHTYFTARDNANVLKILTQFIALNIGSIMELDFLELDSNLIEIKARKKNAT